MPILIVSILIQLMLVIHVVKTGRNTTWIWIVVMLPVAKSILDKHIEHNHDYKNQEAHLLFAKSLEQLGDIELALEEYAVLDGYYLGPEPTYRFAKLLRKQGDEQDF